MAAGQGGDTATSSGAGALDAAAIVERVERNIDQLPSLAAKVRNQVDLFDHQATGSGLYLQQGRGLRQLSRFELKSRLKDATYTLLQINDGRFFWTFRELPTGPSLSQLDLDRIETQLRNGPRRAGAPRAEPLPIGGLPKLIAGLRESFRFTRVAQSHLGERPVWVVHGQWKPAALAAALPDQRSAIAAGHPIDFTKLPAHLPERVLLYIGQSDWIPYRIEYLRRGSGSGGAGQGGILPGFHPIVTTEFFDVHVNAAIDAREFVYQPSGLTQPKGLKVIDATDAFLKQISARQMAK